MLELSVKVWQCKITLELLLKTEYLPSQLTQQPLEHVTVERSDLLMKLMTMMHGQGEEGWSFASTMPGVPCVARPSVFLMLS